MHRQDAGATKNFADRWRLNRWLTKNYEQQE
jgi:hypothetical protein